MAGFTPQELAEMARADAEIEREFEDTEWQEEPPRESQLVWVSRLARQHHTTYGKFVAAHSPEELRAMVERMREGGDMDVSL